LEEYTEENGVELKTNDLLILIPTSCNFPDEIKSTRIESFEKEVKIPIPHELNSQIKRRPFLLKVYQVSISPTFYLYFFAQKCFAQLFSAYSLAL